MKLKFLGTGGGRFVTGRQRRKTGGIILKTDETQVHLDPGPGALVYAQNKEPEETDAVIVSHGHLDHCNDAKAIIEMITETHEKPGAVFANESVFRGYGDVEKAITEYHKDLVQRVETLEEGSEYTFKDLKIESQEMFHTDPKTQGLKIQTDNRKIGFWTDTKFSEELTEFYKDCDTLVVYCGRPKNDSVPNHTSLDEVPAIVEGSEINTVIITHFGFKFLNTDMAEQKEWLQDQVEQKIIFAKDGMEFPGDTKLSNFAS